MTDKSSGGKLCSGALGPNRPVPMKLFGGWEIDKTPSNCIPRLCSLNITRLVLCKPLGPDVSAVMIAVKMQSSKRTLRSNEINVSESSAGAIELDLTFSLQYPHFLKRNGNQLQIMVQRRKRYKNRAILGFKTLAFGLINMAEVLQRSTNLEKELELIASIKELGKNEIIARILISSLKSQPVDQESSVNGRHMKVPSDRSADVDSEDEEFSSNEEGSDSETVEEPTPGSHSTNLSTRDRLNQWRRQVNTRKARKIFSTRDNVGSDPNAQQRNDRNLKQKFIALLKKFRLPDSEGFDSEEQYQAALEQQLMASGQLQHSADIDEFFEEEDIDDLSDSGQDFDDVSISSTPKPSLRPFFSSCTLVGPEAELYNGERKKRIEYDSQENSGPEQTPDTSDTSLKHTPNEEMVNKRPIGSAEKEKKSKLFQRDKQSTSKDKERKVSSGSMSVTATSASFSKERSMSSTKDVESSPRKSVLDQLNRIFTSEESSIPDQFMLINAGDGSYGQILAQLLERQHFVVAAHNSADIKVSFNCLIAKIQRFCNCNSRAPSAMKVAVLGNDAFINSVLRHYVETFSSKPPDWQNYLRFYIIPLNNMYSQFVKYLGSIDTIYGTNFCNGSWKDLFDEHSSSLSLTQEIIHRIVAYLSGANCTVQIPIAEAMVTYKERSLDDESLQVFIPFICDVKIGVMESIGSHSLDDDCQALSSSPPNASQNNSHIGSIEKSASLTSPLSAKEQPFMSSSLTPPSSPSISANLIGAQNTTSALLSGAQTQLSQSLQTQQPLQSIQSTGTQSTQQTISGDNRNLNPSLNISSNETMDLQLDYWPIPLKSTDVTNKKAESSKFTLKNTFRTLQISRLPNAGELTTHSLTLSYITKEKKQKIMRIGKKKEKERDPENKCLTAEGIHRLVCSCKASQVPLKVIIDGVEWSGVKFFQLTAQWQTQIKYFPIALFSPVPQTETNRIGNRINVCNSLTA